jgi:hypothetical protein
MRKTNTPIISSINNSSIFLEEMKLRNIKEEIIELQKKKNPKYIEYQHIANKLDRIILRLSGISRSVDGNDSPKLANTKNVTWKMLEKLERNCKKSLNLSIW